MRELLPRSGQMATRMVHTQQGATGLENHLEVLPCTAGGVENGAAPRQPGEEGRDLCPVQVVDLAPPFVEHER